ncbi:MAG: hypothetical protein AB1611_05715 [bacterium]
MRTSIIDPAIIIAKVKDLCQRLEFLGIKVGDARKHPRISPVDIFKSLLLIPILRLKSLNQLDNKLRLPEARDSVRMILKAVVRFAQARGYHKVTLSSGRKLIAGIVDGTMIGKKLCSVFYEIGKINLLVDVERIKK